MKNIVVPIDFSPITDKVFAFVEKFSKTNNSSIWCIHVIPQEPIPYNYITGPQHMRDHAASDLKAEHKQLEQKAAELKAKNLTVTALCIRGEIVDKIVEHTSKINADLIIMGTHGHSSIHKTIMGSVSEGVMKKTTCPILFIR